MTGPGASDADWPLVTAVVPVLNKRPYLERCLGSVLDAAAASTGVEVIVVDSGSTDGSLELIARLCRGRARTECLPRSTVAAVRNAGANLARSPLLSFVDCDCVVPRDYFVVLREIFERPEVAATGCRVDYPDDGPWVERIWYLLHDIRGEGFRRYLNAGNFAVRRRAFDAVGGFDEKLVSDEDTELGQRLNDRGFRIWEAERLRVLHLDNPRTLRTFFMKEVWHADGMLATVRPWSLDRLTTMTMLHLAALASAASLLVAGTWALGPRLAAAVAVAFAVPAATTVFRMAQVRRWVPVLPAVVLYQCYYLARLAALWRIVRRTLRPRRRSRWG